MKPRLTWVVCALSGALVAVSTVSAQQDATSAVEGPKNLGDTQADLVYTPVAPCRIIDTRLAGGPIAGGTTRNFRVTGNNLSAQGGSATGCGIPSGPATAAVINFVAVTPAGPGDLRITPFGTPMPTASILNYAAVPGLNIANGPAVRICDPAIALCPSDFTIQADGGATQVVADVQGYYRKTPDLLVDTVGENTALGFYTFQDNTTGAGNAAFGSRTLHHNSTGSFNTAFGYAALSDNTTSSFNTAFGSWALRKNTTGTYNVAVGVQALEMNTEGSSNNAIGSGALYLNTTGGSNIAFGRGALGFNTTGGDNTAVGAYALYSNTTGHDNVAIGRWALFSNETGNRNVVVGSNIFGCISPGDDNVMIASGLCIDYQSGTIIIGGTAHTATYIAGISGSTSGSGVPVLVNYLGKLGTTTSSVRFKEEILGMDEESDVLMKLRPVAFYYKPELDDTHTRQYGLVAEEVAEVAPQLVAYDQDGAPQAVRYHFVNAMLLNEVQKQRRLVEEQRTTIGSQGSKIQGLEARLARLEAAQAGDR